MKKNEIMAAEIVDEETGEVFNAAEMEKQLLFFEQQIAFGCVQIALALKSIRDEKLYLFRCKSMKEYMSEYLPMSPRHAERHLQIADSFSDKALKKFTKTPMKLLLEISRDDELLAFANDPDSEADKVIKKARELEKRKYEKKIADMEDIIDGKEALLEGLRDQTTQKDTEIEKLKNALNKIVSDKGIDPAKAIFITQKKEALALIEEAFSHISGLLGDISNIPQDLMDAELTSKLTYTVAAVKAGIHRVEDAFFMQLANANESVSILPGE